MKHFCSFDVQSRTGAYGVHFCDAENSPFSSLAQDDTFFVVDEKVYEAHEGGLLAPLRDARKHLLAASETIKTFAGVTEICTFLSNHGASRKSKLVSVGGGIVQELTAFSANIYQRGIEWTCVPTTLLAMADSCLGGKNSLNFNGLKNHLGTIYSPKRVYIMPEFLKSLPEQELISGLGEIVKSSLLVPGELFFFDDFEKFPFDAASLRGRDFETWIKKSLMVKRYLIENDEFENGDRRLLNYGHTFGHALESFCDYKIPHGICVAWGMALANRISHSLNLLSSATGLRVLNILDRFFLQAWKSEIAKYDNQLPAILKKISRDKKSSAEHIQFICLQDTISIEACQMKIRLDDLPSLIESFGRSKN